MTETLANRLLAGVVQEEVSKLRTLNQ